MTKCGNCKQEIYKPMGMAINSEVIAPGWLHRDTDRALCPPMEAFPEPAQSTGTPFQDRVKIWVESCFGEKIAKDKTERSHRFLEEALELVQACGCSHSEAQQLVEYVYSRPIGGLRQEVGGTMTTLNALCLAQGVNLRECGEEELDRCWKNLAKIRAKQQAKPKHSPLPQHADSTTVWSGQAPTGIILSPEARNHLEIILGHLNEMNCNTRMAEPEPPNNVSLAKARVKLRGVIGHAKLVADLIPNPDQQTKEELRAAIALSESSVNLLDTKPPKKLVDADLTNTFGDFEMECAIKSLIRKAVAVGSWRIKLKKDDFAESGNLTIGFADLIEYGWLKQSGPPELKQYKPTEALVKRLKEKRSQCWNE